MAGAEQFVEVVQVFEAAVGDDVRHGPFRGAELPRVKRGGGSAERDPRSRRSETWRWITRLTRLPVFWSSVCGLERGGGARQSSGMRIGILGGSFDPVHNGHLGVARAAADALSLERVLLMPAAQAPLRDAGVRADGASRAAMLRLALAELCEREAEQRLELDETELRRGGVSYTVDTLRALRAARPGDEFTWIVGADQLARLGSWREPAELARLADWAAYARPGFDWENLPAPAIPGLKVRRVEPAAGALWDVSSSEIRSRLGRGESVARLLPDKVIEYIRENGLYRPQ